MTKIAGTMQNSHVILVFTKKSSRPRVIVLVRFNVNDDSMNVSSSSRHRCDIFGCILHHVMSVCM